VELGIDVEHDAPIPEQPVAHELTDRETGDAPRGSRRLYASFWPLV
jgi:hypothetical protein